MANDADKLIDTGLDGLIDNIDLDVIGTLPKRSEQFVESFLKDSKGNLVTNAPIHNMMHRFIRIARKRGYSRYLVLGAFGHGKSMISGTYVIMYDCTMKLIEDVRVGDQLMGDDGTPRKVLALGRGREKSYKVTLKNKDTFSCNASHKMPFYISNRWNGYQKGDVVIMTIEEYLALPEWARKNSLKIQKAQLDFKEQRVPMNAYVYGAWLGDGHRARLSFTINDDDTEISDYFEKWGKKYKYELTTNEEKSGCAQYNLIRNGSSFSNQFYKKYHEPLLQYIDGEKRIDKRFLQNSREIRLQLLAGMIDTDGHLIDNCHEWSTKFKGLRDDFLFLCRSLGFSVSHRTKTINGKDYYVVLVSGNTHLTPCKTRKKASERKQIKNPLVYGFDVEDIGEQDYYGVVLDKNKLYLSHDFTIHHNTEQLCIGYALDQIARNPNILIKIIHVSDTEAIARCRAIRNYISQDDDYKRMASHIKPTSMWGAQRFTVERKSPAKDATVEGYSVLSAGIGGRANLLIFDDPQDLKTAVYEPTTRARIEDTFKNIWLTRLIPGDSEALVMMNKWHESDLASFIQKNPTWAWMSVAVSECRTFLVVKDSFGRDLKVPLWKLFNKKDLDQKFTDVGERDFNRGYRLVPYSDSDKSFPSFSKCCNYEVSALTIVQNQKSWIFVAGIDFSGTKRPGTIISVVAVHRKTGMKVPVYIKALRNSSDLMTEIITTYKRFGVELYMAENNGVQDAIIDLLETALGKDKLKKYNIKIEGFQTGRNKADENTGLPSLNKEFEKREWLFCFPEGKPDITTFDKNNTWEKMYHEMLNHPFYESNDIVMSLWFCREAAKSIIRKSDGPNVY
jgi:hypothetical protein